MTPTTTTTTVPAAAPTPRDPSMLAYLELELANAIARLDAARKSIRYTPRVADRYAAQYLACQDAHFDVQEARDCVRAELYEIREVDYAQRKFESFRLEA